ncbi:MAG: amidase [Clostridiales bacterium]|nr:amidase [Clostridiales bacterium]
MIFQPLEKSIMELQNAMEKNEITSLELTRFYLDRIETYDQEGPKLNSIVTINKHAIDDAKRLDLERKNKGKLSNLHGIPIVVKDNINTMDMPTTASSVLLAENHPTRDAFIVEKLREAGAVILAKTNLSEFACHGFTDGTLMGQTLNPYDLTRTPGGSSGGTGAAVAANFAVSGLGTDTVNSVRSPASANNLVGFRPSTGLLSRGGIIPVTETQDTAGTLTRSVMDVAILLDVCVGFDPEDVLSAEQSGHIPTSYTEHLKLDGLRNKRLGLLSNAQGNDADVNRIMEESLQLMVDNGAEVIVVDVPEFEMNRIGKDCDVQYYEFKKQLDLYFSNAADCPVPNFQYLANSDRLYPVIADFIKECAQVEDPNQLEGYKDKLLNIIRNRSLAYYVMAEYKLDAFVYPHQNILVQHVGLQTQQGRNGMLASTLGFPAVTVPAGFSKKNHEAPIGVPIGIEFMARRWDEPTLFEIAYGFEQLSQSRTLPPMTP